MAFFLNSPPGRDYWCNYSEEKPSLFVRRGLPEANFFGSCGLAYALGGAGDESGRGCHFFVPRGLATLNKRQLFKRGDAWEDFSFQHLQESSAAG
jgi:hypothetical protein